MFYTLDFRKHLLRRGGDQLLYLACRCARKRDKHIGKGNIDLRLFFARRNQYRKDTQ